MMTPEHIAQLTERLKSTSERLIEEAGKLSALAELIRKELQMCAPQAEEVKAVRHL